MDIDSAETMMDMACENEKATTVKEAPLVDKCVSTLTAENNEENKAFDKAGKTDILKTTSSQEVMAVENSATNVDQMQQQESVGLQASALADEKTPEESEGVECVVDKVVHRESTEALNDTTNVGVTNQNENVAMISSAAEENKLADVTTHKTISHVDIMNATSEELTANDEIAPEKAVEVLSIEIIQNETNLAEVQENERINTLAAETTKIPKENCEATSAAPVSGLNLLAQYCSSSENESDNESVIDMGVVRPDNYRSAVVEINSDTDSDSDSASEPEFISRIRKAIDNDGMDDDEDDDDGDEEGGGRKNGKGKKREPPRAKGELLLDDLPPIQDLQISVPEEECIELGRIHSIVEQLVLVSVLVDSVLVDLETVLFLEKGKRVLGTVFDVIGQVADPLYCVRFNSQQHIHEKQIAVGDIVYLAPKTEHTQFIILSNLTQMRGSDASWENDMEPPPRFLDYSDDEEERRARAKTKNRDRAQDDDQLKTETPQAKCFAATASEHSPNPTNHAQRNYNSRGGGVGGRRGSGDGGNRNYRRSHEPPQSYRNNTRYQSPAPRYQQQYNNNYNPNSWHSNYYPAYNGGGGPPSFNYRMPLPSMPMYGPPSTQQPQYGQPNPPPPPSPYFNASAYGPMHEPSMPSSSSLSNHNNPTYVVNPYALMRHPPPPPPPSAQQQTFSHHPSDSWQPPNAASPSSSSSTAHHHHPNQSM